MIDDNGRGYQREIEGRMAYYAQRFAFFMRCGGGPLPQDKYGGGEMRGIDVRSTPEQQKVMFSMASTGRFSGVDIAKAIGLPPDLVRGWLRRKGYSFSDGRCKRKVKQAGATLKAA